MSLANQLIRVVGRAAAEGVQTWLRQRSAAPAPHPRGTAGQTRSGQPRSGRAPSRPASEARRQEQTAAAPYPGDFHGTPTIRYEPHPGNLADPGEVVWAWVPYEEDHSRGKDRPVLIIGRDGEWLLALQLTSKDHDRDAEQERRAGRLWMDIGSGGWDRSGRPSEVRLNRILRIDPAQVRRMGAALPQQTFEQVAAAVRSGS